jgi:hypothetical protein
VVADIDQMILLLSIPQIWNLERNIGGFESESILIIMSCSIALRYIEKREMDYRLHALLGAGLSSEMTEQILAIQAEGP